MSDYDVNSGKYSFPLQFLQARVRFQHFPIHNFRSCVRITCVTQNLIINLSDIRTERQTLRVSSLELALEAHISQGRLSYLERCIVQPHAGELWRIQEALDRIRIRRLAELGPRVQESSLKPATEQASAMIEADNRAAA